jgi:drug/metabolite transporter (DMT)-like permease
VKQNQEAKKSGWPIIALAASLWGTDPIIRPILLKSGYSASVIVLFEHLALAAVFLPVLIKGRAEWQKLSGRQWLGLLVIAWGGSAIATILLTLAYSLGDPVSATLLQKLQPVFAVLLAGIFLKEVRHALFWPLFALAVLAALLISFGLPPFHGLQKPTSALAAGYSVAAAAIWGSCTVIGRAELASLSPNLLAGWRFLLALPLLLAINAKSGLQVGPVNVGTIWPLLAIVLLPDRAGMVLYYRGLNHTPASVATLAELAYPFSALILGLLFAGTRLGPGQWLGIALLLGSLQLIQMTQAVAQKRKETLQY